MKLFGKKPIALSGTLPFKANLKTGVSKKQGTPNFPKNEHFLPPYTHTDVCVSGDKKCLFFGKFGVLCFLETPILRFTLLPYYRRIALPVYARCNKYIFDLQLKILVIIFKEGIQRIAET